MRALALLPLLAACAGPPCPAGTAPATTATLAFGRDGPDGALRVTEADWADFLAREATPRFPDGLTVLDAAGQWRGADGTVRGEPARLLWLVLPGQDAAAAAPRALALAEAYRRRFHQESVLTALGPSCASF